MAVVIDLNGTDDERDAVPRVAQALGAGQVVALPTETVYGLAVSGRHPSAVERLVTVKGRPEGHPFALAVRNGDEALQYCPALSAVGRRFVRRCYPGPMTLVVDATHPDSLATWLPENVRRAVCPAGTVGLRVPDHRALLSVLKALDGPIVLTSANRSGMHPALTVEEVVDTLGDAIDLVLADTKSKYSQPSSVVRVDGNRLSILRRGVVTDAAVRRYGSLMVLLVCTGNTCRSPMAQVLLQKHIAERLGCTADELEDRGVMVMSAGVAAGSGGHASEEAVEAMQEHGLDLSRHETRPLSDVLVRFADIILTMTRTHRETVISQWPEAAARTHLVCSDQHDIQDPIGGTVAVYLECAAQLDAALRERLDDLGLDSLPVLV